MSENLSIREILDRLTRRIAFHREQEAHHASQEEHHGQQKDHHAAELAKAETSLAAFEASATTALSFVANPDDELPRPEDELLDLGPASRPKLGRMVAKVLERLDPEKPFSPTTLAQAVNQRFGGRLRRPVGGRQVSFVLRRMCQQGRLVAVRKGRPYLEALYRRR
jgi:hypothetical protein